MLFRTLKIVACALCFACAGAGISWSGHKVVGIVLTGDLSRYRDAHKAFIKVMAAKGYDRGNVEYLVQTPNPDLASWSNAARKMSAVGVDLVVAFGAPAAQAVAREADEIPMVFVDVFGPQEAGVIRTLLGDGGMATGVSSKVPLITIVKTAQELRPINTIGVVFNPRESGSQFQCRELKKLAAKNGYAVLEIPFSAGSSVEQSVNPVLGKIDVLFVSENCSANRSLDRIIARATAEHVPVITTIPGAAERGALLSLEISPAEQGQLAAELAAKALAGVSVGQMAVRTPGQIELIVNLKAAKTLDIHVPFQVLNMATKVLK